MGIEMGLQAISWQAYWLDSAWTRPGKTHAFPRGVCGLGDRALCGYEPAWDCNTIHGSEPECKRCRTIADREDVHTCI